MAKFQVQSMSRNATLYAIRDRLIVAPVIHTTDGVGLSVEPKCFTLSVDRSRLADALRDALNASTQVVPHPARDQWKGLFAPFLEAAGVRSFRAFMAHAKHASVREEGGRITVTASHNEGVRGGFVPMRDAADIEAGQPFDQVVDAVLARMI